MSASISITFILFLLAFIFVGILSVRKSKKTNEDYLIAGRSVTAWSSALSAVASNNSGYMFIGIIGLTYMIGLASVWIIFAWVIGDYLAWKMVFKRIRQRAEDVKATTFSAVLGGDRDNNRLVLIVSSIIIVTFLSVYAAAQLKAGSKALHVLFGWDYSVGAILGTIIVVIYCFAGGIRASIWTDVCQSIVMFVAMALLYAAALSHVGGPIELYYQLQQIDPALVSVIPQGLEMGLGLYILGWVVAGFGVLGQPHIQIRNMAIDRVESIDKARKIYFWWYTPFKVLVFFVGLYARVIIEDVTSFDAELALPVIALKLLPGVFVGLILAGLFAATMSTADSQILSCSGAISQDIFPKLGDCVIKTKLVTLGVAAVMLAIALAGSQSVFELVIIAWSSLASGLGPLLVLRAYNADVGPNQAVAIMLSGIVAVVVWRFVFDLSAHVYDVLPGMLAGFAVYGLCRLYNKGSQRLVEQEEYNEQI